MSQKVALSLGLLSVLFVYSVSVSGYYTSNFKLETPTNALSDHQLRAALSDFLLYSLCQYFLCIKYIFQLVRSLLDIHTYNEY